MAQVELRNVTRRYGSDVFALRELSLDVADGEFIIMVGPSGCGKSTALRLLAGLDKPTSGDILIGGRVVNSMDPGERDIAMVFQNYALYPHMSVYRNLAYGLRQRKTPKHEVDERVRRTSAMLGLESLLERKPAQLSGGQRQRVAMGRALVREPQVFLLDEPLSNLDAKLRSEVRGQLKQLHRRLGITTIYVTHDQVEAMTLGDRICVMSEGASQQLGSPQEIYESPANTFVAGFMGSPAMNLARVPVVDGQVMWGGLSVSRVGPGLDEVTVGVRPESFRIVGADETAAIAIVDFVEPLGSHNLVHVRMEVGGGDPRAGERQVQTDELVVVQVPAKERPTPGTRIHLAIDPTAVFLFHAESGVALTGVECSRVAHTS
ncbi:MAG: sn-glycerol-3-phosphate ABC transporter ATP-binding protein UgpC [Candidatus Nanopelagicales bacterium]